ncbi:VOC family protein [Actinocorallia lasiicapitis]
MPTRLNPYISFPDGQAKQAMEFYHSVLGGSLALHTFGEYGGEDAPFADQIMHGMLETDLGFTLMGADVPPGMDVVFGSNIAVSLSGDADTAETLRTYYKSLSAGGTVTVPLAVQMWGDEFGAWTDRFGIPWMVNIGQG